MYVFLLFLQLAPQPIVGIGLLHQQPPGLTKLVQASHINVIYQFIISQWDQIGRMCVYMYLYVCM
jgi:hypothetical protein